MQNQAHILTLVNKLMIKILNLKLVQKAALQIGQKKFLSSKKFKIECREHMLLMFLMEKKLLKLFLEKNCKKQIKKNLELKK